jgi:2-methylcitrate dehydratase PrpD
MRTVDFIHGTCWTDLPADVQNMARRCLLDTLGAGIGGSQTDLSRIIRDFAAINFGGGQAALWMDGRTVSPVGAALANAMTIDSLDIHDGFRPVKGHAGAALVPALLATAKLGQDPASGAELLAALVMGYEIACRAGAALHNTVSDYHTSGAWNALGCAAITSRRLGSDADVTRHALGIAEYHGPRSQMMRVIDYPTMLKDGSGWGAMAGVSAGLMAASGFTGAPAITVEEARVADYWADLGQTWLIREQYFKPHAVCYWAQPAVTGAIKLRDDHDLQVEDIKSIRVHAFHEATRLAVREPADTEQAQYSLPFPVASGLVHGRLGPDQLSGEALKQPQVLDLSSRVEMIEDDEYNRRFPEERLQRVEIFTHDGRQLDTGTLTTKWDVSSEPPSDDDLLTKFRWISRTALDDERAAAVEQTAWNLAQAESAQALNDLLSAAV